MESHGARGRPGRVRFPREGDPPAHAWLHRLLRHRRPPRRPGRRLADRDDPDPRRRGTPGWTSAAAPAGTTVDPGLRRHDARRRTYEADPADTAADPDRRRCDARRRKCEADPAGTAVDPGRFGRRASALRPEGQTVAGYPIRHPRRNGLLHDARPHHRTGTDGPVRLECHDFPAPHHPDRADCRYRPHGRSDPGRADPVRTLRHDPGPSVRPSDHWIPRLWTTDVDRRHRRRRRSAQHRPARARRNRRGAGRAADRHAHHRRRSWHRECWRTSGHHHLNRHFARPRGHRSGPVVRPNSPIARYWVRHGVGSALCHLRTMPGCGHAHQIAAKAPLFWQHRHDLTRRPALVHAYGCRQNPDHHSPR